MSMLVECLSIIGIAAVIIIALIKFVMEMKMQIRVKENPEEFGKCGCGRSPTGKCIGWHGLTEELYQHQKMLWMEDLMRKDDEADELKN